MDIFEDVDDELGFNEIDDDTEMENVSDELFLIDVQPDIKDKSGVLLICKDVHNLTDDEPRGSKEHGKRTLVVPIIDIKKDVYLLANKDSTYQECISEINTLIDKEKDEIVSKDGFEELEYCFSNLKSVPKGKSNYIIVKQHYNSRPLTEKTIKRKKCKHIVYSIGYNENIVKSFMVNNKIYGPCYITLNMLQLEEQDVQNETRTICDKEYKPISMNSKYFELEVSGEEDENTSFDVQDIETMFIRVSCTINHHKKSKEVVAIQCLTNHGVSKCFIRGIPWIHKSLYKFPVGDEDETIIKCKDEQDLLLKFLQYLRKCDPDVLVGHKLNGDDVPTIINRSIVNNISLSCTLYLSRIFNSRYKIKGRMLCDLWDFLLVKGNAKSKKGHNCLKSYDLYELARIFTDMENCEENGMELYEYYALNRLDSYCDMLLMECRMLQRLESKFNIIELTKLLSQYSGCLWSESLMEGKSVMNEMTFLHEFKKRNLVPPPSNISLIGNKRPQRSRNTPTYAGGKILDVVPGYYTGSMYLLDVKSLYPSICSLLKICFCEDEEDKFLYKLFEDLINKREMYRQHPVKQMALKITNNSRYGVLGMPNFRFCRVDLAETITGKGRQILTSLIAKAVEHKLEVIYGHTDSIMVKLPDVGPDESENILHDILEDINDMYEYIKVKIDGKYDKVLIYNKTGYVGLNYDSEVNDFSITGTKIIARDTCLYQTSVCRSILDEIFKYGSIDDINDNKGKLVRSINEIVYDMEDKIRGDDIDLTQLLITKKIGVSIKSRLNGELTENTTPHLLVAKWMHDDGIKVSKNDIIQYLVCKKKNSSKSRLYVHLSQYEQQTSLLDINYDYYTNDRLRSIVKSVCEPISDINKLLFVLKSK